MSAPSISLALVNPGGSGAPPSIDQVPIFVGTAESGTVGTIYTVGTAKAARDILTRGHLLKVVEYAFARGAESVKFCRETGSVSAVTSSVSQVGSGGTVAISGTISEELSCQIRITTGAGVGAAAGVAKFQYTLDNFADSGVDPTWSDIITVPSGLAYTFPGTAMVATFDDDPTAIAAGDTFSWTTKPPHYGATEIADVTESVQEPAAGDATFICYTGQPATASAANTVAAAVNSQIATLFAAAFFFGAVTGGGRGTAAELVTATASTVATVPFVGIVYGFGYVTNPVSQPGRGIVALCAQDIAAVRIMESKISTPPGRTASGALASVTGTDYDARLEGSALYDARLGALTTYQARLSGGVFVQDVRLLDAPTGDFQSWPDAAVMITALRAVHPVAWLQIQEIFRQNADLTMDARDRVTLKSACDRALSNTLLTPLNVRGFEGHVSAANSVVSKTTQLPAIQVDIAIRRLGVGKFITFSLRYAGEVG